MSEKEFGALTSMLFSCLSGQTSPTQTAQAYPQTLRALVDCTGKKVNHARSNLFMWQIGFMMIEALLAAKRVKSGDRERDGVRRDNHR